MSEWTEGFKRLFSPPCCYFFILQPDSYVLFSLEPSDAGHVWEVCIYCMAPIWSANILLSIYPVS